MKQFTDNDIKKCGLEILSCVHHFCVEHNLKYVLFYGSLLGAVRHKGYIPWDDDIDIAMPRDDYEKFIRTFDSENYGVKNSFTDKNYYLPWAKVYDKRTIKIEPVPVSCEIGFNIDLFPVDLFSTPENYWKVKQKEYKLIRQYNHSLYNVDKIRSLKDFAKRVVHLIYRKKINKYAQLIEHFFINNDLTLKKSCLVSNSVFYGVKTTFLVFPKNMFLNRELALFEGNKYFIPNCYKDVLTRCYGSYMELPPEENRVTHHTFKAYFKNE